MTRIQVGNRNGAHYGSTLSHHLDNFLRHLRNVSWDAVQVYSAEIGVPVPLTQWMRAYGRMAEQYSHRGIRYVYNKVVDQYNSIARFEMNMSNRRRRIQPRPDGAPAPHGPDVTDPAADSHPRDGDRVTADQKNRMSKATAYSTTLCCVDLGSMQTKPAPVSHVAQSRLGRPRTKAMNFGKVLTSNENQKSYHVAGEYLLNATGNLYNRLVPSSGNDNWGNFNSVAMYQDMFDQTHTRKAGDAELTARTQTEIDALKPVYGGAGVGVTDANWAKAGYMVLSQHLELKIKNVTSAGDSAVETPAYISLYWCRLKKDILIDKATIATQSYLREPLQHHVNMGWAQAYDTVALVGNEEASGLLRSTAQPYATNISDNEFIMSECEIVSSKKFVLANGQTGTVNLHMGPQYQNGSHYLRAHAFGSGANDYNPIACKKGEQFMVICVHGCLGARGATSSIPTGSTIEGTTLVTHSLFRYKYMEVMNSTFGEELMINNETAPSTNVDVDFDHTTTA